MAACEISIIIPAFNEEALLPAALASLLRQDFTGRMHIVVAANGCDDRTVEVARSYESRFAQSSHFLHVISLSERSKCRAINAAEELLPRGPRIYLDADVLVSSNAVAACALLLDDASAGIHLCAPRLRVEPGGSRFARMYGRIWVSLPIVRDGVIGAGFLAVSQAGRTRWTDFPDITADDYFIESHFDGPERRVIDDASFTVRLPERWREMIAVRSRWVRGAREWRRLSARRLPRRRSGLFRLVLPRPSLWAGAMVYVVTNLLGSLRARRRVTGPQGWERAAGTRAGSG